MASVRDRKVRIVQRGLRLLQECKVPRFSPTDPAELDHLQQAWSEQVVSLLTRLLRFLERHRQTLFEQDWGPVTKDFRKYFVLVYFEHSDVLYERAEYQPEEDSADELELRFSEFEEEVDRILTKESNSALRTWLFHHYGCVLGMEGWQNQPGEVYSFVRLSCFLVASERTVKVHLGPRALSFAETFGLRLLGERQNEGYQTLGVRLMYVVMRYTCENDGYTSNAEDILELALRLVQKQFDEDDDDLFNIVYYAVRSVEVPNRSLDDEVMRTLVYLLSDEDTTIMDTTVMRTLIRILLLEVPEVQMDERDCEKFTINGRVSSGDKLLSHLKERFQCNSEPLDSRISIRWKFRIGQLMPKLLRRIVGSCHLDRSCLPSLGVLVWLITFPIGPTWHQKYARSEMLNDMMDALVSGLSDLMQNVSDGNIAVSVQSQQLLYRDFHALFVPIQQGIRVLFMECIAKLRLSCQTPYLVWVKFMVKNLEERMTGINQRFTQMVPGPGQGQ